MPDKPAFDPSKPYQVVGQSNGGADKPAFDPNQPFQAASAAPQTGIGEAIYRGGAEGGGFGFAPKIEAIQSAGRSTAPGADLVSGETDIGDLARGLYKYWSNNPQAVAAYNKKLAEEQARNELVAKQNPAAYNIAQFGGAMAVPMPATKLREFGLLGRMAENAAVGGGFGALSGLGQAQGEPGDYLKQAGLGGAIGAAGGGLITPLGEGLIHGGSALYNKFTYPLRTASEEGAKDIASRYLATAHGLDVRSTPGGVPGFTPAEVAATPHAIVGDIGAGAMQTLARNAANVSPEAQNILDATLMGRANTRGARLIDQINSHFSYPDAAATQKALDATELQTNNQNYKKAFTEGDRPILTNDMLSRIQDSKRMQDAIRAAVPDAKDDAAIGRVGARDSGITFDQKGMPVFNNGAPNLHFWDLVKRNLDDSASSAFRAGNKNEGSRFKTLAEDLRNQLDQATTDTSGTSSYQKARSAASQFFGAENASEAGSKFFLNKMEANDARDALAKFTPTERALFQDAFLSEYKKYIAGAGDRSTSILDKINGSEKAREKINVALGPVRAKELESMIRSENIMNRMKSAVYGGSNTTKQILASMALGGALGGGGQAYEEGGFDWKNPGAIIGASLMGAHKQLALKADQRVMTQVAKMITSRDPSVIARGHQLIARSENIMKALQHIDTMTAQGIGSEAGSTRY